MEINSESKDEIKVLDLDVLYDHIRSKYFNKKEIKKDYEEFMSNFNFIMEFLKLDKCEYTYDEYVEHIKNNKYEIFNRQGCYDNKGDKFVVYDDKITLLRNVLTTFERELDNIIRTYGCFGRLCFSNRIKYKNNFKKDY